MTTGIESGAAVDAGRIGIDSRCQEEPATLEISKLGNRPRTRVGVVDDDVSLGRALRRLLASDGFSVVVFASAEAFLASDDRSDCGCLVLDVHLGGLSGFELYESLIASGTTLPVIFITAHDDATTQERARANTAVAYLRKPFEDDVLIEAVRSVM